MPHETDRTAGGSTIRTRSSADWRVVAVEPLEHLRLAVRFADGLTGEVVLKKSSLCGVFQALNDPVLFAQVSCAQGFVE